MSNFKTEPRFIFYTTNVLLLALAELSLMILSWGITVSKMMNKTIESDVGPIIITLTVTRTVKSKKFDETYPSLMKKLEAIPEGFSPYLKKLKVNTVLKGDDVLEFIMFPIKSEDYPDNPWKEIEKIEKDIFRLKKGIDKKQVEIAQFQKEIEQLQLNPWEEIKKREKQISRRKKNVAKKQVKIAQLQENLLQLEKNDPHDVLSDIRKVLSGGEHLIGNLEEKKKIISYYPKTRKTNVLILHSVNGSMAKARDLQYLTELRDEMVLQGNAFAKTPICAVVTSGLETRERLILRKLKS